MILLHHETDPITERHLFSMEVDHQFLASMTTPIPQGDLEPRAWMAAVILIFQQAQEMERARARSVEDQT